MDRELLSRMIAELVLDHDKVGLPGVGTFITEVMPAAFSEKGYTINPPYRRLSFHSSVMEENLIVDFYAEKNNVPLDIAREYIFQFLAGLKDVLKERKTVVLPGLGRLRATRENNFFFVPAEDLDIFPEAFALRPVSLKSHPLIDEQVEIPFEFKPQVAPAPQPEPQLQPDPAPQPQVVPVAEPEPAPEPEDNPLPVSEPELESDPVPEPLPAPEPEPAPAPAPEPAPAPAPEPIPVVEQEIEYEEEAVAKKPCRWWIAVVVLLVLAAVALAAFLILVQVAPDFVDSILYTPEELRIINY